MTDVNSMNLQELIDIIEQNINNPSQQLLDEANEKRIQNYGQNVYLRGLIELTNYCKNNCYYCGIRCENKNAHRYRLTKEQVLQSCKAGYDVGFKTFVLQGGEDPYYTDSIMVDLISSIKQKYPDCALTLSIGEKPFETYKKYY